MYNPRMSKMQQQSSAAESPPQSDAEGLAERLTRCEEELLRKDAELARKEAQITDLFRRMAAMVSADNARQVHFDNMRQINNNLRRQRDELQKRQRDELQKQLAVNNNLRSQRDELQKQLAGIVESRGWRLLTEAHRLRLRVLGTFESR